MVPGRVAHTNHSAQLVPEVSELVSGGFGTVHRSAIEHEAEYELIF